MHEKKTKTCLQFRPIRNGKERCNEENRAIEMVMATTKIVQTGKNVRKWDNYTIKNPGKFVFVGCLSRLDASNENHNSLTYVRFSSNMIFD